MLINHLMDQSVIIIPPLASRQGGGYSNELFHKSICPSVCMCVCGNFVALRRDHYDDNYD